MQSKNKLQQDEDKFNLPGVGKQIAKYLARLNIHSLTDLLLHLPLRYQDRTQITPIRALMIGQEAVIEGVIQSAQTPMRGRTKLLCDVSDGTGRLQLRFFHIFPQQKNMLQLGNRIRCYGEVRLGMKGLEIFHPEFKVIQPDTVLPTEKYLTPIYPATEGLSQYMLRKLTSNALEKLQTKKIFIELLPEIILKELNFPQIETAIHDVHRPTRDIDINHLHETKAIAQQRLIFEELLAHRISLLHVKQLFQQHQAIALSQCKKLRNLFLKNLSFQLTNAQQRTVNEITQDLQCARPMLRLLQGDVGSGKTVVAALAILQAVENHQQSVLMVPTELLAEQHYRTISHWFAALNIRVALLTGQIKISERKKILAELKSGVIQVIIGTHALFQKDIEYKNLALVVADEQHRFGVEQRALLREKGVHENYYPHQLIMTATPIPRTLAMSFYADLDCSIIDELPPGRIPIVTSVIANSRRSEIIARLQHNFAEGKQAYWVCALIEESEKLNCESAISTAEILQKALSSYRIGLIHGRMLASEKDDIMQDFKKGDIHLLVATTVIEVGVDVPNASVMVIENAERLGLSQLHQLRGRVGRGSVASHCILLYQHPLSELAKARLQVMRETTDGFKIAQRDLELRGPGEVLGVRQTGDLSFKVADLTRDIALLSLVQNAAKKIMDQYPENIEPLIARWIGEKKEYGKV